MVVPMVLFSLVNWLVNFEVAIAVLIVLGLIGIVLHEKLMKAITKTYVAKKYAMIHAFDQEN
jgi:xanthosine utilization system XapX-like protein